MLNKLVLFFTLVAFISTAENHCFCKTGKNGVDLASSQHKDKAELFIKNEITNNINRYNSAVKGNPQYPEIEMISYKSVESMTANYAGKTVKGDIFNPKTVKKVDLWRATFALKSQDRKYKSDFAYLYIEAIDHKKKPNFNLNFVTIKRISDKSKTIRKYEEKISRSDKGYAKRDLSPLANFNVIMEDHTFNHYFSNEFQHDTCVHFAIFLNKMLRVYMKKLQLDRKTNAQFNPISSLFGESGPHCDRSDIVVNKFNTESEIQESRKSFGLDNSFDPENRDEDIIVQDSNLDSLEYSFSKTKTSDSKVNEENHLEDENQHNKAGNKKPDLLYSISDNDDSKNSFNSKKDNKDFDIISSQFFDLSHSNTQKHQKSHKIHESEFIEDQSDHIQNSSRNYDDQVITSMDKYDTPKKFLTSEIIHEDDLLSNEDNFVDNLENIEENEEEENNEQNQEEEDNNIEQNQEEEQELVDVDDESDKIHDFKRKPDKKVHVILPTFESADDYDEEKIAEEKIRSQTVELEMAQKRKRIIERPSIIFEEETSRSILNDQPLHKTQKSEKNDQNRSNNLANSRDIGKQFNERQSFIPRFKRTQNIQGKERSKPVLPSKNPLFNKKDEQNLIPSKQNDKKFKRKPDQSMANSLKRQEIKLKQFENKKPTGKEAKLKSEKIPVRERQQESSLLNDIDEESSVDFAHQKQDLNSNRPDSIQLRKKQLNLLVKNDKNAGTVRDSINLRKEQLSNVENKGTIRDSISLRKEQLSNVDNKGTIRDSIPLRKEQLSKVKSIGTGYNNIEPSNDQLSNVINIGTIRDSINLRKEQLPKAKNIDTVHNNIELSEDDLSNMKNIGTIRDSIALRKEQLSNKAKNVQKSDQSNLKYNEKEHLKAEKDILQEIEKNENMIIRQQPRAFDLHRRDSLDLAQKRFQKKNNKSSKAVNWEVDQDSLDNYTTIPSNDQSVISHNSEIEPIENKKFEISEEEDSLNNYTTVPLNDQSAISQNQKIEPIENNKSEIFEKEEEKNHSGEKHSSTTGSNDEQLLSKIEIDKVSKNNEDKLLGPKIDVPLIENVILRNDIVFRKNIVRKVGNNNQNYGEDQDFEMEDLDFGSFNPNDYDTSNNLNKINEKSSNLMNSEISNIQKTNSNHKNDQSTLDNQINLLSKNAKNEEINQSNNLLERKSQKFERSQISPSIESKNPFKKESITKVRVSVNKDRSHINDSKSKDTTINDQPSHILDYEVSAFPIVVLQEEDMPENVDKKLSLEQPFGDLQISAPLENEYLRTVAKITNQNIRSLESIEKDYQAILEANIFSNGKEQKEVLVQSTSEELDLFNMEYNQQDNKRSSEDELKFQTSKKFIEQFVWFVKKVHTWTREEQNILGFPQKFSFKINTDLTIEVNCKRKLKRILILYLAMLEFKLNQSVEVNSYKSPGQASLNIQFHFNGDESRLVGKFVSAENISTLSDEQLVDMIKEAVAFWRSESAGVKIKILNLNDVFKALKIKGRKLFN